MSSSVELSAVSKIMDLAAGPNAMIGKPEFRYNQNLSSIWSVDLIVDYYDNNGVMNTISMTGQGQKKAAAKLESCQYIYGRLSDLLFPRKGGCKIMKWQEGKTAEKGKIAEKATLVRETTSVEPSSPDGSALDSSSATSADSTSRPSTPEVEPVPVPPTPRQRQLYKDGVRHTSRLFETATWASTSPSSSNELTTQLQNLNINTPSLPKGRVYISFDLEATTDSYKGHSSGTPTQLGLTIFRGTTPNLSALISGPPTPALTTSTSIQPLHYQFSEFTQYRSRIGKLAKSGRFLYGRTQVVPAAEMNAICKDIVERESQHGEIVLVGHAVTNDIRYLLKAGIYAFCPYFEGALDTQQIFLDEYGRAKGLKALVEGYGGRMEGWHNAGNDAVWTMWVVMKRLADGKGEVVERMEDRERRKVEEERRREGEWEAVEKKGGNPWVVGEGGWDWGSGYTAPVDYK
ncbi:qde-2-interacting protein [Rutstroemia sp. NJR-2017a WRK4]|nr:qde-2-interacting protein [Rutstroemia sp. NJR-2017a WRK4]